MAAFGADSRSAIWVLHRPVKGHTMKLSLLLIAPIAGLLFAALGLPSAHARLAPTNGMGGSGGSPFRVDCGELGVLVGLIGQAGEVIDRVGGLCIKVEPRFGTMIGAVYETTGHGGPGGGTFRRKCPARQVVVGISGETRYFGGATVVSSLNVVCMELGINATNPRIMATQGTSKLHWDPSAVKQDLDLCSTTSRDASRQWTTMGLALEGSTGNYLDRLRLVCGTLRYDPSGVRIEMQSSPANGIVSDGAAVTLRWRIHSTRPDLTPNLHSTWVLLDHNHPLKNALGFEEPSDFRNPCAYAQVPCNQNAATSVTFKRLPPGIYELRVTAEPTVIPAHVDGDIRLQERIRFEVRSSLAQASPTEKLQASPLGALAATPHTATATATDKQAFKGRGLIAARASGAASAPVLKLPPKQASPFAPVPNTTLKTPPEKPASRAPGAIGSASTGPGPTAIDALVPKSAFEAAR